ncbi:MAG TPA: TonB-dependent receptor [Bryobacteraceae bacterium]|nr:TonB-dependent receptor [Bryobacteraceae bacterium]
MSFLRQPLTLLLTALTVATLAASEYRGTVKTGALPVPGATVTASQGDKRVVTTTDDQGIFLFQNLSEGSWTVEVEMFGFARLNRSVTVAPGTPAAEWGLQYLSQEALTAGLKRKPPAQVAPAAAPPAQIGNRNRRAAVPPSPGQQLPGFQRLDVTQSINPPLFAGETGIRAEDVAYLNQSAANSFLVQGSVSSAAVMNPQNDWGFGGGPRGMGMDGFGPGGPGMMNTMPGQGMGGGPNGDGPPVAMGQGRVPGGPGGFGGRGGPGGFGGGRFGGPGGPGGPDGFGGPGGPRGQRGAMGGRDRRGWQGRPDARAFGNRRRGQRNMYNAMAFFSLGNSVWDARAFSVTGADLAKPSYGDGRGGFLFGGPLQIPKLISANKRIFVMVNYQFQRSHTGTLSQPVNMPTELERFGDFSRTSVLGAPVTIVDPSTGAPFPGNKIPLDRIDPAARALLNYFPQPNQPFDARNYQTSLSGSSTSDNLITRIMNVRVTAKDQIDGGVAFQQRSTTSPNLFQFIDTGSGRGINANLGWSHRFNRSFTNNLRYTFSRNRDLSLPYFANRVNVAAQLNIAGTSQDPRNWGPPNLNFTNYAGLTDGNSSLGRNQTSALSETLLWVHGTHNVSFGGGYRRQQFNQLADTDGRGSFTFNGLGTGYDLADFLLGTPTAGAIRYGNPDKYFRGTGYDAFVNDDWRIATRLSLNFGVRWDYSTPVTELYDRMVNLNIGAGFVSAAPLLQSNAALIRPDRNNFSPRLGFAWRPRAKGSMIVRGGYGVYYNSSVYNMIASNMAQQPPFASALSATGTPANPLTIRNAFLLASSTGVTNTFAVDPDYRIGYVQTWTLSLQRDLFFGMFGTAGYLGTKGTRLDQQFVPNSVAPGAPESALPHSFIYETSNGNSIYHAAQFQLNRRFRSGFMAHASYQFSKSIDNGGTGGRGQGNTPVAQNWLDLSAERGLSSFDSRHNLSLQFQYSTGMGRAGGTMLNGRKGTLLKDWTLSGNINGRSGSPFTALAGGSRSQVGGTAVNNTVRANASGLPIDAPGMLFNTAAFTLPLAGHWGTAGRNTIPGPTVFFLNGSLGRVFRFGERRSADLQFQAQNLLNRVTITNWGTLVGSNNYGLATGAAPMRRLTIMLRFRF